MAVSRESKRVIAILLQAKGAKLWLGMRFINGLFNLGRFLI